MLSTDKSGPRDPYFLAMQTLLHEAAESQPRLIVDLDRFDRNVERVATMLPPGMAFRVVAKSLPIMGLLDRVRQRLQTDRVMTFNLPMLQDLSAVQPGLDQMLGKPFPVAAAAAFLESGPTAETLARIHWLVDTPARMAQYAALSEARCCVFNLCLELDVGLHRGGFAPDGALADALAMAMREPGLRLTGLMGYDAHIGKAPDLAGLRPRAQQKAEALYCKTVRMIEEICGDRIATALIRNAAGSPTLPFYRDTEVANELSAGSILVKPTDFDLPHLADFEPATFIASPVLKALGPMQTPILEPLDGLKRRLDPNLAQSLFIHGGYWKATPFDPPGLRYNSVYGRSSNQELLTAGPKTDIAPDDFVFFRPTQSEAVFLQFGSVLCVSAGRIVGEMAPFPVSP